MKKKTGKLALHRETVAALETLSNVEGGDRLTVLSCFTICDRCAVSVVRSECACQTQGGNTCLC